MYLDILTDIKIRGVNRLKKSHTYFEKVKEKSRKVKFSKSQEGESHCQNQKVIKLLGLEKTILIKKI